MESVAARGEAGRERLLISAKLVRSCLARAPVPAGRAFGIREVRHYTLLIYDISRYGTYRTVQSAEANEL